MLTDEEAAHHCGLHAQCLNEKRVDAEDILGHWQGLDMILSNDVKVLSC